MGGQYWWKVPNEYRKAILDEILDIDVQKYNNNVKKRESGSVGNPGRRG